MCEEGFLLEMSSQQKQRFSFSLDLYLLGWIVMLYFIATSTWNKVTLLEEHKFCTCFQIFTCA